MNPLIENTALPSAFAGKSAGKSEGRVRKAVFPVAGLGIRFFPATKACAKEMLPVVDKPLIQYAVEEAIAAGIEEMIFVTSRNKRALEDHFDSNPEVERALKKQQRMGELDAMRKMFSSRIRYSYVRQDAPRGLGHAVLCARHLVGDEPFVVILPDDVIDDPVPVTRQLIDLFEATKSSLVAVEPIDPEQTRRFGIVDTQIVRPGLERITGIVEKPDPQEAPTNLGVVGRYLFTARIFDHLERLAPGKGGEIQLTDAICLLFQREPVYIHRFAGQRFDCGSKIGYLQAMLHFGIKHPEIGEEFSQLVWQAGKRQTTRRRTLLFNTSRVAEV